MFLGMPFPCLVVVVMVTRVFIGVQGKLIAVFRLLPVGFPKRPGRLHDRMYFFGNRREHEGIVHFHEGVNFLGNVVLAKLPVLCRDDKATDRAAAAPSNRLLEDDATRSKRVAFLD